MPLDPALPFTVTIWSEVEASVHPGSTGEATWRTVMVGDTRTRMVQYSAGYLADHWCSRGHVLLVLEGSLRTELDDGRVHPARRRRELHRLHRHGGAPLEHPGRGPLVHCRLSVQHWMSSTPSHPIPQSQVRPVKIIVGFALTR